MSWEYRVVQKKENGYEYLKIEEVYYNEKGEIVAFGDAPVPYGESKEYIKECLDLMYKALEKEIIEE